MGAGNEREFIDYLQSKEGKEQAMRCPILEIGWMQTKVGDKGQSSDCLKEECAWYRKEYPACCIYSIERAMWAIASELATIMTKMPHAG